MMFSCAVYRVGVKLQQIKGNNQALEIATVVGCSHHADDAVEVKMPKQMVSVEGGHHETNDEVPWITLRRFRKIPLVRDNSGAWIKDESNLSLYDWAARHVDHTGLRIRSKTPYGPLIKTQMQVAEPDSEAFLGKLLHEFKDMKSEYRKVHSGSDAPGLKIDVEPIFEQEPSVSSSSRSTAASSTDQANEAQGEVPETSSALPEDADDISVWIAFIKQNIRHTFIHVKIDTDEDVTRPSTAPAKVLPL